MEATASLRRARISPRKVRIILNATETSRSMWRSRNLGHQQARLEFYKPASAVANANVRYGTAERASCTFRGVRRRRSNASAFPPRAMGRATRINKRTGHITVTVALDD